MKQLGMESRYPRQHSSQLYWVTLTLAYDHDIRIRSRFFLQST